MNAKLNKITVISGNSLNKNKIIENMVNNEKTILKEKVINKTKNENKNEILRKCLIYITNEDIVDIDIIEQKVIIKITQNNDFIDKEFNFNEIGVDIDLINTMISLINIKNSKGKVCLYVKGLDVDYTELNILCELFKKAIENENINIIIDTKNQIIIEMLRLYIKLNRIDKKDISFYAFDNEKLEKISMYETEQFVKYPRAWSAYDEIITDLFDLTFYDDNVNNNVENINKINKKMITL